MTSTGTATSSGIIYGPNGTGKLYLSSYDHRGRGDKVRKNVWAQQISPPIEFDIFCNSDQCQWCGADGDYWAVYQGGEEIGERGERIGKFPFNHNAGDPWHGYPVSPADAPQADMPPDDILDRWVNEGIVTAVFRKRIRRLKI